MQVALSRAQRNFVEKELLMTCGEAQEFRARQAGRFSEKALSDVTFEGTPALKDEYIDLEAARPANEVSTKTTDNIVGLAGCPTRTETAKGDLRCNCGHKGKKKTPNHDQRLHSRRITH